MSEKQYFNRSFLAPIIVPFFAYVIALLIGPGESLILDGAYFLFFSLLYGGIPYLIFLAFYFYWQKNKNAKQIKYFTLVAPFIFTSIFLVLFFLYVGTIETGGFSGMISGDGFWSGILMFGKFSLLTSFGYVLAIYLIYYILLGLNKIEVNKPVA
ncbi:MAG: hypothetical protein WD059_08725 [Balneolaceae bacterium]